MMRDFGRPGGLETRDQYGSVNFRQLTARTSTITTTPRSMHREDLRRGFSIYVPLYHLSFF